MTTVGMDENNLKQTNNWHPVIILGFPGGSDGKAFVYNAGDSGSNPGLEKSPGEGNSNPLHDLLPGESHGQRSLVGCSPWGRKESDTTE